MPASVPRIGDVVPVQALVVRIHAAENSHAYAGTGENRRDAVAVVVPTVAQRERAVFVARDAEMDGRPLDPRLEVRGALAAIGRAYDARFVETTKIGQIARIHEPLQERWTEFVELEHDRLGR